ncbi:MAG: twin-arginine translocase subunit TatC, partial [Alphaproteobacteria bacterium]|nr:twin-arginine translocase subunit TatC [Alphaproteobacteria bacterium]
FGLFFQMPVGITLVVRAGIVSADQLARGRKYAVVVVFLTAAVLTPPDIISQVGLALPGLVLYEISIVLARRIERRRARAEAEADAEEEAEG